MKWFGNTSRVWQTALPGATTRTAAVFLAGQAHHAASPLRLFESGEWFLFAGSQTPLTVLSSTLSSVWMSAHSPQDGSYKPFDLFPCPSVCEYVCGCVSGKKPEWVLMGGLMEGDGVNGGHFEGTPLCGFKGPLAVPLYSHPLPPGPSTFCCTTQHSCPHASRSGYPRWTSWILITTPTPILRLLPMLMHRDLLGTKPIWASGHSHRTLKPSRWLDIVVQAVGDMVYWAPILAS